jgi:transcriptional regulator with XRE-family HTH domain
MEQQLPASPISSVMFRALEKEASPSPREMDRDGSENASGTSEQRRRELAEFLRSRRERLKPDQVGISHVARRRTPGLRREEVAELAGVGTTWYTWLEQARDIQPSAEVLRRLASALKMSPVEIRHLYALAGKAPPAESDSHLREQPSEALLNTLNSSIQVPAILLGTRWDVLAINQKADQAFPYLMPVLRDHGNWLKFLLETPSREGLIAWESNVRRVIAEFRSSVSDMVDHPWVLELIEELKAKSPEFATWWKDHDVRDNTPTIVEVTDREKGLSQRYERVLLSAHENARFKFLIFNPIA